TYFLLSLLCLMFLYLAWWASRPTYVRFLPSPWVFALILVPVYWLVHHWTDQTNRFSAHMAMGSYGLVFLLMGLFYVGVWLSGGRPGWAPRVASDQALHYPLPF